MLKIYCYRWEALDQQNNYLRGTILVRNRTEAYARLNAQQLLPFTLKCTIQPIIITTQHAELFLQQLYHLLHAQLPVLAALQLLIQQETGKHTVFLANHCAQIISSGETLSKALEQLPELFTVITSKFIAVGEATGKLTSTLQLTIQQLQQERTLRDQIIHALTYPTILLGSTAVIIWLFIQFIVPQFTIIFNDFNVPLPAYTQLMLRIIFFLKKQLPILISSFIGVTILLRYLKKHFMPLLWLFSRLQLKMPIIGKLTQKQLLILQMQTLSFCLATGFTILQTLDFMRMISSNLLQQQDLLLLQQLIKNGSSFGEALKIVPLFPQAVQQLLVVGETSGTLPQQAADLANLYTQKLQRHYTKILQLFEPLTLIILGTIIGCLIIALYLPIFSLGNAL